MTPVITIEKPFNNIDIIHIFKPVNRGAGGTMAFPVNINGFKDFFEMNEDCLWQPTYKVQLLSTHIVDFIGELIETVLMPLISSERKNRNVLNNCARQSFMYRSIDFVRFYSHEANTGSRYKILCRMNKNALHS